MNKNHLWMYVTGNHKLMNYVYNVKTRENIAIVNEIHSGISPKFILYIKIISLRISRLPLFSLKGYIYFDFNCQHFHPGLHLSA